MQLPFLTIPIALPGDETKGNQDKEVPCKIAPVSIQAYHEGFSWGTFVYTNTGQAFCCTLPVAEFENLLKQYWIEVAKQTKRSNLKLLQ